VTIERMSIMGAFVLGLLHTFHPCEDKGVASMIATWAGKRLKDALLLIILFGIGTTLTNAVMGAIAGYIGSLLFVRYGALFKTIAGVAIALFGLWILRGGGGHTFASPMEEEKLRSKTAWSVFLMAIVGGLPICPFELAVLTWVASVGDVWRGVLIVLAFGLGTTIGLIPWGFAMSSLGELARRMGYGVWVPKIMGILLMAMGTFIALSAWI
jgi:cytochrome c biogenesis protein CcdA